MNHYKFFFSALLLLVVWGVTYNNATQNSISRIKICEHAREHPEDEAFADDQCIGQLTIVRQKDMTPEYFSVVLPRDLYDATIQRTEPGKKGGVGLLNVVFTRQR